jgi:hypothetical protein
MVLNVEQNPIQAYMKGKTVLIVIFCLLLYQDLHNFKNKYSFNVDHHSVLIANCLSLSGECILLTACQLIHRFLSLYFVSCLTAPNTVLIFFFDLVFF